jgi:hypothetical protein
MSGAGFCDTHQSVSKCVMGIATLNLSYSEDVASDNELTPIKYTVVHPCEHVTHGLWQCRNR